MTDELKRSRTFDGGEKPEIDGVYERHYDIVLKTWMFSLFKNRRWHWGHVDARKASEEQGQSPFQELPWRGLATKDGK